MFGDLLSDIAKGVGSIVGTVVGPIVGVSVDVIAGALNITTDMVKAAKDAGCESYEEIRDFYKD